jgi:hypothetical protein
MGPRPFSETEAGTRSGVKTRRSLLAVTNPNQVPRMRSKRRVGPCSVDNFAVGDPSEWTHVSQH